MALIVAVDRLSLFVGKPRPMRNAWLERVSQIDKRLGLDGFKKLGQRRFLGLLATARREHQQAENHQWPYELSFHVFPPALCFRKSKATTGVVVFCIPCVIHRRIPSKRNE